MWKVIFLLTILKVIHATDLRILEFSNKSDLNDEITEEVEKTIGKLLKSPAYAMGTDCNRQCRPNDARICYQIFNLESYQAMGAACGNCSRGEFNDCKRKQCLPVDGIERGILTINRELPGPLIEVCQGDAIVVDVINKFHSESTSIHWHGVLQRDTPYMDGVPFVTQCPIHPNNRFRYTYRAREHGTYFYHSHSGVQRYSGIYGGLVVRRDRDPQAMYYTKDEHTMVLSDWSHESPEMFSVGLPSRPPALLPQSALIEGMGNFFDNSTRQWTQSPYKTFYVSRGQRYRFRIVNAASTACPMRVQIQNHDMTIIATDGDDVEPTTVNTLFICSGERFDVVINANRPERLYWIHLRLVGLCEELNIYQTAVLSYVPNSGDRNAIPNTPKTVTGYPRRLAMNDPSVQCGQSALNLCITDLVNKNPNNIYNQRPDMQVFLGMNIIQMNTNNFFNQERFTTFFNLRDEEIYLGTINNISFASPPYPILSQENQIDRDLFCNSNRKPLSCRNQEICTCSHTFSVGRNNLVEIILYDELDVEMPLTHPIHFHGYKFVVISQVRIPSNTSMTVDRIKELQRTGRLNGRNPKPPLKDTIALQNQGIVVLRLKADNPGPWLLHCHIEDHLMFGMGAVMMVEGIRRPRPWNFPTCGNFP